MGRGRDRGRPAKWGGERVWGVVVVVGCFFWVFNVDEKMNVCIMGTADVQESRKTKLNQMIEEHLWRALESRRNC